ncbi:hypothetical protein CgunFtcFv8_021663 [Champsocephalus gunnari]|uniref:Uncharacterized protein n=1 Tax=Champsocephalus gunnari TaxID=52237 RepID=A0AAN8DPT2_CHAGU|nr:hypothetical protein CgunFtcFv8_021663 [Champsocephalus gunnari]
MGDFFTTGQALDPETAQFAENQRGAGSTTGIAQDRSVVNQPQLSNFSAETVNINTYGQGPDRTDTTNSSSPQNNANIKRCQAELKSSEEVLERLLPVLKASRVALLRVRLLSDGLRSPNCKLKILRLASCEFKRGCAALASSLKSNPAHLRVLDLAQNVLQDGDVENLSEFLAEPLCQLETLDLNSNKMTAVGCGSLTIALSGSSALKELDLSFNSLMDEGAVRISDWLRNPQCRLKILRLASCKFKRGCAALASSLKSNPAHLRVLDLAQNVLQDGDVENLSQFLAEPLCQLETLDLNSNEMTAVGCGSLTIALSGSSALKELDLSFNSLMDEGAVRISDWLRNPQCTLKILRLASCQFTERGCAALASSLKSNPAHLRVLDLAQNDLQDGDVENLSQFLAEPLCQLEKLELNYCTLNVACLRSLTLAFSGSSALKELDLSGNRLMDEGAILLSDWLRKTQCELKILRLANSIDKFCAGHVITSGLMPRS